MQTTLFTNVQVLDGTGALPYAAEVLVEGNRISHVARQAGTISRSAHRVVDGGGATLMPGLVDAHLHLTWNNQPSLSAIQQMPPEEHVLFASEMAKLVLDHGFTSGFGAAAAKPRLDVVIRNAINSGRIPGPRYKAAGQEIATHGGLGDTCPPHIEHEGLNFGYIVSGPEEVRRAVRLFIKYGVDNIKLNLSGEEIVGVGANETPMSREEVAMACSEAKMRGKTLCAHARSAQSIKLCVDYGIEVIYHASYADEEALDKLEAVKDRHFVAPALAWLIGTARYAEAYGIIPGTPLADQYEAELEVACQNMKKMHQRGIRVLPGGDYGFAWIPHGTNARDLEYFVDLVGFTPMEAILSATKYGGQLMGMGEELGQIQPGYLADLLLVNGDPLGDVTILQDQANLLAIMKDGTFHKEPAPALQDLAVAPPPAQPAYAEQAAP
ncbi:amidohydrolase family protein [Telmatospirillum sp. J64-1]|uniref:metal-dependent hydrolase family protein n=1 Tax=Telmatospirillum sp. J64-1 TaxID=2502183 RepID=UPI00115DC789|nr:amidohydrolase family protein [Telmatospirillum sp. J64-1]